MAAEQKQHYDVIVVGAGVHGSACAYKLTTQLPTNSRILLLEQFSPLHNKGSSHGHSRICRFSDSDPVYAAMGRESIAQWRQIQRLAGYGESDPTRVYHQTGGLDFGDKGDPQLNRVIQSASEVGFDIEVWDAEQLRSKFPILSGVPDTYRAVYQEDAGILDAECAVDMFHRLCRQSSRVSCDIHWNECIGDIKDCSSTENDNIVHVQTNVTSYTCSKLVLTCGAWIPQIVKRNFQLDLKLEVRRQSYYFWRTNQAFASEFNKLPIYIHWGATPYDNMDSVEDRNFDWGFYGFRGDFEKEGYIKVAIHEALDEERGVDPDDRAERIDEKNEPRVPERKVEILRRFLTKLFTDGSLCPETYEQMYEQGNVVTCLYTCHPTDDYIIDKLPGSNNIIIGSPCSGHGFKNASIVSDFLVQLVMEDSEHESEYFLGSYHRSKFSMKHIL